MGETQTELKTLMTHRGWQGRGNFLAIFPVPAFLQLEVDYLRFGAPPSVAAFQVKHPHHVLTRCPHKFDAIWGAGENRELPRQILARNQREISKNCGI